MNKIIIFISIVLFVIFLNIGLSCHKQADDLTVQKDQLDQENQILAQELSQKEQFVKREPVAMEEAFNLFLNLKRMLENYGGTKMEFLFSSKSGNDSLQDFYIESNFKNVKELPIILKITKFSKDTDDTSVLKDIYMLEKETDFKVDHITGENEVIEVKGELYGI